MMTRKNFLILFCLLIFALVVVFFFSRQKKQDAELVKEILEKAVLATERFQVEIGTYPNSLDELIRGGYLPDSFLTQYQGQQVKGFLMSFD